jgi:hypothetical protein
VRSLAVVTAPPVIGDCRLCHAQGIPLRLSRVLPRWAYPGTPQVEEPLHCEACEGRLAHDTDYVAHLAYTGDHLGLLEHVIPGPGPREDLRVASLRGFNAPAMARFAASVFWRAHVSSRPECGRLFLSSAEEQSLRDYLRGVRPKPSRLCLTVAALIEDDGAGVPPWTTTSFPVTDTRGEDRWHMFAVAGLAFSLSAGDAAAGIGGTCLACGHDPHVVFTAWSRVRHVVTLTDALLTGVRKSRPITMPRPISR